MEIIVRALVVFAFLWLVTRVVGRASLSEVTTFELLLYVTMGDLVQQAVTQQDYSLTSAFLAIGVFALLTIALSYSSWRWPRLRPIIRGTPVMVMRNGEPIGKVMRRQRLAMDDVMAAASPCRSARRCASPSPGVPRMIGRSRGHRHEE